MGYKRRKQKDHRSETPKNPTPAPATPPPELTPPVQPPTTTSPPVAAPHPLAPLPPSSSPEKTGPLPDFAFSAAPPCASSSSTAESHQEPTSCGDDSLPSDHPLPSDDVEPDDVGYPFLSESSDVSPDIAGLLPHLDMVTFMAVCMLLTKEMDEQGDDLSSFGSCKEEGKSSSGSGGGSDDDGNGGGEGDVGV